MLYLALTIVVSSLVLTILKYGRLKKLNVDYIILVNYIFATAVAGIAAGRDGLFKAIPLIQQSRITTLFSEISVPNTVLLIFVLSLFSGVLYYTALIVSQISVVINGMGATSMFNRLSFLVPLIGSAVLWREYPSGLSIIGMLLGVISLYLMIKKTGSLGTGNMNFLPLCLLLANGIVEINNKILVMHSAGPEYKNLFVFTTFVFAALFCGTVIILKGRKVCLGKIGIKEILLGMGLGLPNVLNSVLLLKALEILPAGVVYATVAAGGVLMSNIIGLTVFKECIGRYQKIAMILTIFSIVLINIG